MNEKIFDSNALSEYRISSNKKRLIFDNVAQFFGLSLEEIESIKKDSSLYERYKKAAEQSRTTINGKDIYEEFLERIGLWKENDSWVALDLLGYFCFKYEECYKKDFIFGPCKNPFSSKEMKRAAELMSLLVNKESAKKYIDWAFDVKAKNKGFNIFSIAILTNSWLLNEFNVFAAKKLEKNRTTPLPEDFVEWCKDCAPMIFDNYEVRIIGNVKTFDGMVRQGYANDDMVKIVSEAKKRGII